MVFRNNFVDDPTPRLLFISLHYTLKGAIALKNDCYKRMITCSLSYFLTPVLKRHMRLR